MIKKTLGLIAAASILFACQNNPNPSSQNDLKQIAPTQVDQKLDSGTVDPFATNAALGGMMEVESSAHMIKLTENPDVQTLATIMVKDHTMANKELAAIAKSMKIRIPQNLTPTQQDTLKQLDGLKEFERNLFYTKLMLSEHDKAIKLFETASNEQSNGKLKIFAKDKLPRLKHHQMEVKRVLDILQKIKGDRGDKPLEISQGTSKAN